jgi:hypothetical protein
MNGLPNSWASLFSQHPRVAATVCVGLLGFLVPVLIGCSGGGKPTIPKDREPIVAPGADAPAEEMSLFGPQWTPSPPPDGQVYHPIHTPKDIADSPHAAAIDRMVRLSIIPVAENGLFYPREPLSRGEALLWFYNAYNAHEVKHHALEGKAKQPSDTGEGDWDEIVYGEDVPPYFGVLATALVNAGLLSPSNAWLSRPDISVNREELAAMAWMFTQHGLSPNAFQAVTADADELESEDAQAINPLSASLQQIYGQSVEEVDTRYLSGIDYLTRHRGGNIIQAAFLGEGAKKSLAPKRTVSREEAASILAQIQPDFEARIFKTRKSSPPSRQPGYSDSYAEQTPAEDSSLPDFFE